MGYVQLENVETDFCLKDVNLSIKRGEFVVIMGHSGAGKSTILNVLAGFIEHHGKLYIDGKLFNGVPTQKREMGYLHQDIHLFPNLNVFENIAFGLRAKKYRKENIHNEVNQMLQMLKISHLATRYPKNLSGGERQRVGIARAIITKPKVLLLDEPLSSLDSKTAEEIRNELKMLHQKLELTIVYVTHNIMDTQMLAQKVVAIENGRIIDSKI